jgi:hypothetical protein
VGLSSVVAGCRDFERRAVVEPAVGPVVVVGDVGGDHLAGVVEGLELVSPDAALLERAEPGLDERLAFGVAVAAAAVRDPRAGQDGLEGAGGERRAVVGT